MFRITDGSIAIDASVIFPEKLLKPKQNNNKQLKLL